jgi:hypothetical protein
MKRTLILSLAVLGAACSGGESTRPPVPTSISLSVSSVTLTSLGATQTVTAIVRDENGQPMPGEPVNWNTNSPSVEVTANGASAQVKALAKGEGIVRASSGALAPATLTVTVDQVPAAITKVAGDGQSAPMGTAVAIPPSARVSDASGAPIAGVQVHFSVASGGSVTGAFQTTDHQGVATVGMWTLGATAGPMTLTATVTSGPGLPPVSFEATALPGQLPTVASVHSGQWQAAIQGSTVSAAPGIVLRDMENKPVPGRTVTFAVTGGAGTITQPVAVTDANGVARVGSWTLGASAGINALTATVSGDAVTNAVITFEATGCTGSSSTAGFTINVCFLTPVTASQRAAFLNASAKWSSIITGNLPSQVFNVTSPGCTGGSATPSPSLNLNIDDVVIFARIENIDGPGAVLGSAGPCFVRDVSPHLPFLGQMRFDVADLPGLEASGLFTDVILHEMGHVLGLGIRASLGATPILWGPFVANASTPGTGSGCATGAVTLDTHFTGPAAQAAFNTYMPGYVAGAVVPVANVSCGGSINQHWRESVLGAELMTPNINSGVPNPLSIVTVMSLQDIGYEVNPGAADSHVLGNVHADVPASSKSFFLGNDVYVDEIMTIDAKGQVRRIR